MPSLRSLRDLLAWVLLMAAGAATCVAAEDLGASAASDDESSWSAEAGPLEGGAAAADEAAEGWLQPNGDADMAGGPDVYLLPDAEGRLRQVLGFRYEDFQRAWRLSQARVAAGGRPAFAIQRLKLEGRASERAAELTATVELTLLADGWVRVPLRLGNMIVERYALDGPEGDDEQFLAVEGTPPGYVAWLRGAPGERRTVTLEGRIALRTSGVEQILETQTPAAVNSLIVLDVPGGDVLVETSDASTAAVEALDAQQSRIRTAALGGSFGLRWRPREAPNPETAFTIEAEQQLHVSLDPGRVRYEATFQLQTYGRPVQRVQIALPPRAELATSPDSRDYELALSPPTSSGGERIVEVRFREPTNEPPQIALTMEQAVGDGEPDGAYPITAPRLVGAFRQSGVLALQVSEALHAHWELAGGIEQIAAAELPEALRARAPRAGFAFSAAPWELRAFVQARQRRARVRPKYELTLSSQGAQLEVEYDYRIVGGRTWNLPIDLQGWEFTEPLVESGGSVRPDGVVITRDQRLLLELVDPDATQVRLRFTLQRATGLGSLRLPLPQPLDAFMLPAVLDVVSEPSLLATPRLNNSTGIALVNESAPDEAVATADPAASPDVQRFQAYLKQAALAVDVTQRPQEIVTTRTVEADFTEGGVRLRQRIDFEVRHQAVTELSVLAPAQLMGATGATLELNGEPLPAGSYVDQSLPDAAVRRLTAPLPRAMTGRFSLGLRCFLPLLFDDRNSEQTLALPLLQTTPPATQTQASLLAPDALRVELPSDAVAMGWREVDGDPSAYGAVRFVANGAADQLPLAISTRQGASDRRTIVDRAWLQTWISGGARQDRFVCRLWSEASRVTLELPPNFRGDGCQTLLDGKPLASVSDASTRPSADQLSLELTSGYHVVELRSQRPHALDGWASLACEPPRIVGATHAGPMFWQIVTPYAFAAWLTPETLAPEYRWGWEGWRWGRQPTLSQTQLEAWSGGGALPGPPPSAHSYLYRSLAPAQPVQLALLRRGWLVAAVATPLLVAGALLAAGRRGVLRGAAYGLLAATVVALSLRPELGAAFAQGLLVAVFLILMAWLLHRGLVARRLLEATAEPTGRSSPYGSTGATRVWPPETSLEARRDVAGASAGSGAGALP